MLKRSTKDPGRVVFARCLVTLIAFTACANDAGDAGHTPGANGGSGARAGTAGTTAMPGSGGTMAAAGAGVAGTPATFAGGTTGGTPSGVGGTSGSATGGSAGSARAGTTGMGGALAGQGGQSVAGASGGPGGTPSSSGAGGASPATGGVAGRGASGGTSGGSSGGVATCTASKLSKGDSTRMLDVGGTSRSYILHVPASYTGATAVPLVLDFHALGGSGSQEQSSSGYQALADKEGFLIAFPNGIDNAWNIGPCCTNSRDVDDLGFAKGMVTAIAKDGCVDPKRVYATGFSMGGGMSHYLACNAADVFAAATPASFDLLVPDEEPCAPSRPISVLTFRGTADTVVPFNGGQGSSGRITFLGAQKSFERWAGIDGCTGSTTSDGDCTYYEQCEGGVEVGLCVKQGGSHAPGDSNVGWAFLKKFTLP